jgi:hypothetical protein
MTRHNRSSSSDGRAAACRVTLRQYLPLTVTRQVGGHVREDLMP